jgi:hypothetical protein
MSAEESRYLTYLSTGRFELFAVRVLLEKLRFLLSSTPLHGLQKGRLACGMLSHRSKLSIASMGVYDGTTPGSSYN